MIKRIASAAMGGSLMTLSLLFAMQHLIGIQPQVLVETRERGNLNVVRVKRDEELRRREERIVDPEQLTNTPKPPPRQRTSNPTQRVGVHTLPKPPGGGSTGPEFVPGSNDGPLVAVVRVQPVYPPRAESQGLEGYVIVSFDVGPDGRVINVGVVESSHRLFERAAIEAAKRFRYRARVVDGVAQTTYGLQNLFRFELDSH